MNEDYLDPRLREYLERQKRMEVLQDDPQYRASQREGRESRDVQKSLGNLTSSLAESAAMMGQVGGKRADTSGIQKFYDRQRQDAEESAPHKPDVGGLDPRVLALLQESRAKERATMGKTGGMTEYQRETLKLREKELAKPTPGMTPFQLFQVGEAKKADERRPPGTGEQFKAAGFARRMEQAEQVFQDLEKRGYSRADTSSALGAYLPNVMRSTEGLSQDQAERNFVNAILREESGAAIAPTEFENASKQYFPRAGDTPEVLAQKKANRQQAIETLKAESGRTYDKVPQIAVPKTEEKPPAGTALAAPDTKTIKDPNDPSKKITVRKQPDGSWVEVP